MGQDAKGPLGVNGEKAPVVKNALSELGKPDAGPLILDIMPGSQVRSYSMPVRRHGGAKRRPARDNGLATVRKDGEEEGGRGGALGRRDPDSHGVSVLVLRRRKSESRGPAGTAGGASSRRRERPGVKRPGARGRPIPLAPT